jgi:hypothetical protein
MKFKKVKNKEILVFELHHFIVRMAIVKRSGKHAKVSTSVELPCINPIEGAAACLNELRSLSKRIPKTVVMVSTEAMPALFNLKFTAGQTITEQEEIIRWEMEENLSVFTNTPSADTILQYPGFLQKKQWQKLLEFEETKPGGTEQNIVERLKNASVMDSIDLEEVHDFLDQWPHADEASMCSWSNDFSEKAKNDSCLSAFLGIPRRDIWLDFFDQEGLKLCGTLPWSLSALSLLDKELIQEENLLYIEEHPGFWVTARLRKGTLINIQCYESPTQDIPTGIIKEIEESDSNLLTINSLSHNFADFTALLVEETKKLREIKLPESSDKLNIEAAARQAWQLPVNFKHVVLPTALPPISLGRRPQTWWLAVGLAAGIFYSVLIFSWIKELNVLSDRFSKIEKTNKDFGNKIKQMKEGSKKVVQLEKSIESAEESIKILSKEVKHAMLLSSDFIVQFTRLLNKISISSISLKSVTCSREGHFEIYGMALSEVGAYELAREIANTLKLSKAPALTLEKTDTNFTFIISIIPQKGAL